MENFGIPVSITLMFQWLRHSVWDFSKLRPRGSFYLPQVFLGPSALHSQGMPHRLLSTILSILFFPHEQFAKLRSNYLLNLISFCSKWGVRVFFF